MIITMYFLESVEEVLFSHDSNIGPKRKNKSQHPT